MPGRRYLVLAGCAIALAIVVGVFGPRLAQRHSDAVRIMPQPGDAGALLAGCPGAGAIVGSAGGSTLHHGDARAARRRPPVTGRHTEDTAAGGRDALRCGNFGTSLR